MYVFNLQCIFRPQGSSALQGVQRQIWEIQQEERLQRGSVGDREQPQSQVHRLPGQSVSVSSVGLLLERSYPARIIV